MQSGSLRTARALVFALALITLLAIAYLSNRAWQDYVESRAEGLAASRAIRSNERLLGWMREAETGQRGYLLTGRPEYLAPYRQALSEITADLGQLRASLANYPVQIALFRRLEGLIDQKRAEMLATLETRDTKGPAAALSIVKSGHGQRLMDEIRTVSQQIGASADAQLTASRNSVRQHTSQARLVTLIGCAILFAILIGAFAANERSSKERENLIAKFAKANRASAEVRDLLRTTFYSIGDGVITTDGAGRVQLMNSMAERLTGFSEAEAHDKEVEEIFRPAAEPSRAPPGYPLRVALNEGPARARLSKGSGAPIRCGRSQARRASWRRAPHPSAAKRATCAGRARVSRRN